MKKTEITLIRLKNSIEPFNNFFAQPVTIKIGMRLKFFAKEFGEKIKIFKEQEVDLYKKYGEKKGAGYEVKETIEKWGDFKNELKELMEEKIELNIPEILEKDLGDNINLSGLDCINLDWLIITDKKDKED